MKMYATVVLDRATEPRIAAIRKRISETSAGYVPSISRTLAMMVEASLPEFESRLGISTETPK